MSVKQLLRRAATFGLPGFEDPFEVGTDERPILPGTWRSLLDRAEDQRVIGLLQAAVDAQALSISDEQRNELTERHIRWCARALRLEDALLKVAAVLDRAGIDVLVLKGSAVAHLVYPDPAWRSFGDNDILLRSEQFDDALDVLAQMGYSRQFAQARAGFDRRFGKGAPLDGEAGDELDTHRNLVFGTFGFLIELDELFDSAVTFELGGRTLNALGSEPRLLHACYHAALGDPKPRYSSVRDVAQMLHTGEHDTRRVLELARRWHGTAVLARAVTLCRGHLGVDVPPAVAAAVDHYAPSRRERRAIASYVGPNRRFAANVVASLPYLPDFRARAEFLRSVAMPEPEFALAHGARPGVPWIRRGVRSALGRQP